MYKYLPVIWVKTAQLFFCGYMFFQAKNVILAFYNSFLTKSNILSRSQDTYPFFFVNRCLHFITIVSTKINIFQRQLFTLEISNWRVWEKQLEFHLFKGLLEHKQTSSIFSFQTFFVWQNHFCQIVLLFWSTFDQTNFQKVVSYLALK